MKIPMSWLDDYTKLSVTPKEYSDGMTLSGSKVESVEELGEGISKVVVGKILSIEKHPDANKLVVCQVDAGEQPIQIVTGAPNVFEGAYIPVALHGSKLPGGITIKKGKLRGVVSEGMFCSTDELGMTDGQAEGVLILDGEPACGTDIKEVLGLNEVVVDFEITSNRPDCFSVIGLARESAATFGQPFSVPVPQFRENQEQIADSLSVSVQNAALCPRYTARMVKNVKIAPSPKWMQDRLQACGVRAINNIVDITNYVMLEYGQPMHAFDIDFLSEKQIVVRCARPGEKIVTLDGVERALQEDMLVICDGKRPVAVAGVMGGENSEITEQTHTVVFESATFFGSSVRSTARRLGLRTEASSRYEKGLDANVTLLAANRACELVEQLGAGEVVGGVLDVYDALPQPRQIPFRPNHINHFLGTSIAQETMVSILETLECKVEGDRVIAPTFRPDLESEADIAEEIARFYGYDKIGSTLMRGESLVGLKTPRQKCEDTVKKLLIGQGLNEVLTYSFTDPRQFDKLCFAADDSRRQAIPISNPLGEERSIMRTTVLSEMLKVLGLNFKRRNATASLFEIGTIYRPKALPLTELPEEPAQVIIGLYGKVDFYDLKGIVEQLLLQLNITDYEVEAVRDNPTFHPGKTARLLIAGEVVGEFGQIHPLVAKNYEIDTEVFLADLSFEVLFAHANEANTYTPLPRYPAVARDIAMVCDETVLVGEIEKIIKRCAGDLLEELTLFDIYQGKQIPKGKKSVAYAITFRHRDKTLEEHEVNVVMDKIVTNLEKQLEAELRKL